MKVKILQLLKNINKDACTTDNNVVNIYFMKSYSIPWRTIVLNYSSSRRTNSLIAIMNTCKVDSSKAWKSKENVSKSFLNIVYNRYSNLFFCVDPIASLPRISEQIPLDLTTDLPNCNNSYSEKNFHFHATKLD